MFEHRLLPKVSVLDDPKHIPERIMQRSDQDPFTDVLQFLVSRRAQVNEPLPFGAGIVDTPVRNSCFGALQSRTLERDDAQLEATDVEPDVERLIEIWLHAGDPDVPLARGGEVCGGILGSTQSQETG